MSSPDDSEDDGHTVRSSVLAGQTPSQSGISRSQLAQYSAILKTARSQGSLTLGQRLARPFYDDESDNSPSLGSRTPSVAPAKRQYVNGSSSWPERPETLAYDDFGLEDAIRLVAARTIRERHLFLPASRGKSDESEHAAEEEPTIPRLASSVVGSLNELLVLLAAARPAGKSGQRKALGPLKAADVLRLSACLPQFAA